MSSFFELNFNVTEPLYTSADGRYYVCQKFYPRHPEGTQVNQYGDILIVRAEDKEIVCRFREGAVVVTRIRDREPDPELGWHGDDLVLLLSPGVNEHRFSPSNAYAVLISVEKGAIVQRVPVYYSDFYLRYNNSTRHLRAFSKADPNHLFWDVMTFMKDKYCSVHATPFAVKVHFTRMYVEIPDLQLIHLPELEMWSPDRHQCCFYARWCDRDVLAVVRLIDEHRAMFDAWYLGIRPERILWDNGFVPVVCGEEARRRPFVWDDIEFVPLTPIFHLNYAGGDRRYQNMLDEADKWADTQEEWEQKYDRARQHQQQLQQLAIEQVAGKQAKPLLIMSVISILGVIAVLTGLIVFLVHTLS